MAQIVDQGFQYHVFAVTRGENSTTALKNQGNKNASLQKK
jgi:hypothetical protein